MLKPTLHNLQQIKDEELGLLQWRCKMCIRVRHQNTAHMLQWYLLSHHCTFDRTLAQLRTYKCLILLSYLNEIEEDKLPSPLRMPYLQIRATHDNTLIQLHNTHLKVTDLWTSPVEVGGFCWLNGVEPLVSQRGRMLDHYRWRSGVDNNNNLLLHTYITHQRTTKR